MILMKTITIQTLEAIMARIKIPVIEITQKGNTFFVGKIQVSTLIKIAQLQLSLDTQSIASIDYLQQIQKKLAVFDIKDPTDSDNIQRRIQLTRLKNIANYIQKEDGMFANTILISLNKKISPSSENDLNKIESNDEFLSIISNPIDRNVKSIEFDTDNIVAYIIDGQHRLASFAYIDERYKQELISEFELPVTVFCDLEFPIQADLFGTINSTQKAVNKSLLYDLTEYKDDYNILKRCHSYAKWFNEKEKSPLKGEIKMLGVGQGSLSQSAFIDSILIYMKEKGQKNFMYTNSNQNNIDLLYNYFVALKEIYILEWEDVVNYRFLKANGFGALMRFMFVAYFVFKSNSKEFSKINLHSIFHKIKKYITFHTNDFPKTGGAGLQVQLYKKLCNAAFFNMTLNDEELNLQIRKLETAIKRFFKDSTLLNKIKISILCFYLPSRFTYNHISQWIEEREIRTSDNSVYSEEIILEVLSSRDFEVSKKDGSNYYNLKE
jgi:DGQHR domain-containing protein